MDPDRWSRIETIFHEAAARPSAERERFLGRVCADDPDVRSHLEKLLEYDDQTPSFIDAPVLGDSPPRPDRDGDAGAIDPRVGRTVGGYRLLERVAAGGMGVVYRARRDDGTVRYPVAVKLVRRGMDTDQILRRFEIERETLAGLSHANIARLLDGGVADDGLPYIVMEFIEGKPIDVFCDEQRLPVRARLRLFREVCLAVHHAHQNLVVHRDLKPSNILVTADGVPKLLDFGIAKVLASGGAEPTVDRTATAARVLTPDYASPEQLRGDAITTATDIYSLGVVLYRLLTGQRPYRITSARVSDIERAVCEEVPTRPSSALGRTTAAGAPRSGASPSPTVVEIARQRGTVPERLRRTVRGDLDNIVLMALRKDAERRYHSAEQLAAEVDRYLDGLPVMARKDTLLYRGAKFVRRNRVGVGAAAVVFLAVATGAVIATEMARRARHEARHARIESDSANEVARILGGAFRTTAGTLEAGVRHLDDEIEPVRREHAHHAHLRANLIDAIGRTFIDLELYERAETLIEEAAAIRRAEFGDEHLEVARSLRSRGELRYARGDYTGAESDYRSALALHRTLPRGVHTDVAGAAGDLARALEAMGRVAEAETLRREARARTGRPDTGEGGD